MNAKHTPGPWVVYADMPSADPNWHLIASADRQRVIANINIEPGSTMDNADASLIVAAPDLLAACKAVEELFGNPFSDPSAFETCEQRKRLQAAIAKAEGR